MCRVWSMAVVIALAAMSQGLHLPTHAAEPGGSWRAARPATHPGGRGGFTGSRGSGGARYPGYGGFGYPWYYGGVFLEAVPYGGNSIVVYDHRWPSVYSYGRPYVAGFGGFVNAPVVLGAPPLLFPAAGREVPEPDSSPDAGSVPPLPVPGSVTPPPNLGDSR